VLRIHHVNLHVPTEQVSAQESFLVDVLGFRQVAPPGELVGRAHWFEDEHGVQVHLSVADGHPPLDPGHVAVVLGDGHTEILERAVAAGLPVKGTGSIVNCWDPAGNRWELRQA
jgi:catechol 2,3-dioxygenase-like lactoylglutathione lyase family enzyme